MSIFTLRAFNLKSLKTDVFARDSKYIFVYFTQFFLTRANKWAFR